MKHVITACALAGLLGCSVLVPGPDDFTYGQDAGRADGGASELDAGDPLDGGLDGSPGDAGSPPSDAARPTRCESADDGCDLIVACSAPAPILGSGATVTVPWQVSNLGDGLRAGPFSIRVRMDRDGTFEEVGSERFAGFVAAASTESGSLTFVAPDWTRTGAQELECLVDLADEVPETNETNNVDTTTLTATGLPDLMIVSVNVSPTPSGRQFDPIDYTVVVRNVGEVLSPSFLFSVGGTDGGGGGGLGSRMVAELRAGETTSVVGPSQLTFDLSGPGTLTFALDSGDAIPESNESNNSRTQNVTWQ